MNNINSNQVSFKSNFIVQPARRYMQEKAASVLSKDISEIKSLTRWSSAKRLGWMDFLVENFNAHNFHRPLEQIESRDLVIDIFKKIKYPRKIHKYIVSNFGDSFENIKKIFENSGRSRKRLNFVKKVNEQVFDRGDSVNRDMSLQLLESPYSDEYVNNFDNYRSYLILNKDNPDAVRNLDKQMESASFSRGEYDKKLRHKRIIQTFPFFQETEILNRETFGENYSHEGGKLLRKLAKYTHVTLEKLRGGDDAIILDILKTTDKKNIKARLGIVDAFKNSFNKTERQNAENDEIAELNKLFHTIENDKNARKFVVRSLDELKERGISLKGLNEVLDQISTKKLSIFRKNAMRIIAITHSGERIEALRHEITNPVFDTEAHIAGRKAHEYYYGKDRTRPIRHLAARIRNLFSIIQDKLTNYSPDDIARMNRVQKDNVLTETVSAPIFNDMETANKEVMAQTAAFDKVAEIKGAVSKEDSVEHIYKSEKPEAETVLPVEKELVSETLAPINEPADAKPVNSRAMAKKALTDNILSFVMQKLGAKTFDRQKAAFGANATKIRLSMLPEIFASIADTRKADRAVGKYRINSSNKDALALYLRINGNNRKFVNYLLKKRNVDNTRMFEVKDIIAMIDKAEAKIAADKKANPKYRARDARRYYNSLYEAKIQQYGKIKRQKNISTKA